MQQRHWIVTYNNPADNIAEIVANTRKLEADGVIRNWSMQIEKVETIHLQAYFGFDKPKRISTLRKILLTEAFHAEKVDHPKKAWEYCMKEKSRVLGPWFKEWTDSTQGKRTDLESAAELVKSSGVDAVAREMPAVFIKYHAGLKALNSILQKDEPVNAPKNVYFFWGDAGCGKTRAALEFPRSVVVGKQGPFYDYVGSETAIFDEADDIEWLRGELLKLTDRYPIQIPVKNGWASWCPKTVIFTSNSHPQSWTCWDESLRRRVTEVRHYTSYGKYTN